VQDFSPKGCLAKPVDNGPAVTHEDLIRPPSFTHASPPRITVRQQSTYCTFTDTVALLLLGNTSWILAETAAVFLRVVPAAALTFTVTLMGPQ